MAEDNKGSAIIPSLLAGAALYFGLSKNSGELADIAKEALSRVVDDQSGKGRTQMKQVHNQAGGTKLRLKNHKPRKPRRPSQ